MNLKLHVSLRLFLWLLASDFTFVYTPRSASLNFQVLILHLAAETFPFYIITFMKKLEITTTSGHSSSKRLNPINHPPYWHTSPKHSTGNTHVGRGVESHCKPRQSIHQSASIATRIPQLAISSIAYWTSAMSSMYLYYLASKHTIFSASVLARDTLLHTGTSCVCAMQVAPT